MSLTVIKNIICELTGYRPGTVDVSQGDRGSRAVSCRLMENGASWMIPEGATARVAYTLPDGTEGLYDRRPDGSPMWEIAKNIVTVELADQLMAQAGMVQMSILIIGPDGGQLATWPIRVMVSANKAARLTVPEAMPPYGAGFAGKIFFGGEDGTVTPLGIGEGVEIVRQEDGTFVLVASGGAGGGGGIAEEQDPTVPAWAKEPQKPAYTAEEVGALPKDTKIPGKTSELTNDAGFVDKAVKDLANYYTKVQTQELIAAIPRFRVTVVQQLPAAGEELVLYLVPFATAEGQYLEYIWAEGRWEIIGSQRVDLTGYATEVWVKDYVEEHTGQNLALDTTLTKSGQAADAKAVGDALDELEGKIPSIDGLAKEEDIPTKPEDINAQPAGNYLTKAPVESVNGKTGVVQLGAEDVGARPDNWMPTAQEVGALPTTYTPPNQTAEQVGADPTGTAASAVSGHNANTESHSDIRLEIKAIREQLAAFLDVDEETLNELSELIAAIAANQTSIAQLTTGKVNVADIIDNLTTNVANKPLSAAQGVKLKALVDGLSTGKLDASKLTEAINTALAQAKASGEFDGAKGDPGQAATFEITGATALAYGAAPTITEQSGSTAHARKYVVGIPAGKPGADAKSPILTMYISPDGSDSNDGLTADTPKKTIKACVGAGATKISAKRGVYAEQVAVSGVEHLEIYPTDNGQEYSTDADWPPIVFDLSDTLAPANLAAYNSIKRIAYTNSANEQFDKVFTKKSQSPVSDEYGKRYNATVWLMSNDEKTVCIKLKPTLTVAECEAEANTFAWVSGYIYINADMTGVEKICVPTNFDSGFRIADAGKVILREVEVRFSGSYNVWLLNCPYFDLYKVSARYSSYASGIDIDNANGRLNACYATKNFDGFGVSGYGHTTYVDCVSEFNFDDGVSHHNGSCGTFIGGRYEGNGKGGNTPAYGAQVNIYGGIYKDNAQFGIGYLYTSGKNPAGGVVQGAVMVGNPVGLSVAQNCNVTAIGCIYVDNTADKNVTGNLTEYNHNYVKSVNGVLPDENGNVTVEGGTGEEDTGPKNLLPLAINSDRTPYVGTNGEKGYKVGWRLSSSGAEKEQAGCAVTGFIPVKAGDILRIKNFTANTAGYGYMFTYKADFTKFGDAMNGSNMANGIVDGVLTVDISEQFASSASAAAYIRFSASEISEDTIVTVNEEIPA